MDYPFRVKNVKDTPYRSNESILPWIHTEIQSLISQYDQNLPIPSPLPVTNAKANGSTTFIISELPERLKGHPQKSAFLLSEIQKRFNGHPKKSAFLINPKTRKDRNVDKKELLSAQIKKRANDWKIYKELAMNWIHSVAGALKHRKDLRC